MTTSDRPCFGGPLILYQYWTEYELVSWFSLTKNSNKNKLMKYSTSLSRGKPDKAPLPNKQISPFLKKSQGSFAESNR